MSYSPPDSPPDSPPYSPPNSPPYSPIGSPTSSESPPGSPSYSPAGSDSNSDSPAGSPSGSPPWSPPNEWDDLRGDEDADTYDQACIDLDRDHEHRQYKTAERQLADDVDEYERQEEIDDRNWRNMDFHQRMQCLDDREEHAGELAGDAFEIANARYAFHGRYDDDSRHEVAAEERMNQYANRREEVERINHERDEEILSDAYGRAQLRGYK